MKPSLHVWKIYFMSPSSCTQSRANYGHLNNIGPTRGWSETNKHFFGNSHKLFSNPSVTWPNSFLYFQSYSILEISSFIPPKYRAISFYWNWKPGYFFPTASMVAFCPAQLVSHTFCQAQLQLKLQSQLELSLVLLLFYPTTHPPTTHPD